MTDVLVSDLGAATDTISVTTDTFDAGAATDVITSVQVTAPHPDAGAATDTLSVHVTGARFADIAAASERVSGGGPPFPRPADEGAATEELTWAGSVGISLTDTGASADGLSATTGTPAPRTSDTYDYTYDDSYGNLRPWALPASPAFIVSQMPRMHAQNLITGTWYHRDIQGVTNPVVTWTLNAPGTFTCTLAPPRADMLDTTGNPLLQEWRDAIYLEESGTIRFGGIITSSTMTGPVWTITATEFTGYPAGMIYEGPNYSHTSLDALDAVRYIWGWLQSQPGGNLGLQISTQKAGFLLGAQIAPGVTTVLTRAAPAGQSVIWIAEAVAFENGEHITISGLPYQIAGIITTSGNVPTGQVYLTQNLTEAHGTGEPVTQVSPVSTPTIGAAKAGQPNVTLRNPGAFAPGMAVQIGSHHYVIDTVNPPTAGGGVCKFTTNLLTAVPAGTTVTQIQTVTPFELFWYNSTDLGQEIASIQQEAVFDLRETHTWSGPSKTGVVHQLSFGVPRIGTRLTGLRFAEGENIVQPATVTRDGTVFADNVVGLGAGTGSASVRATAANASTGRLRRTYVYTDQTVQTVARLSSKVQRVLAAMTNIDTVTQIVVRNHANAPFGSFGPGMIFR